MVCAARGAARAGVAPTVNGLFYGDGDQSRYVLYNTSIGGSKLWYTVVSNRLYVALVVDRSVNDNVFSGNRDYTRDAGWNPPRNASKLINSEYAQFTLTVGGTSFEWDQGYGELVNGAWKSDHTTGAGSGTPPPGYVASSSFAWNINTYLANPSPAWNLYAEGSKIENWQSPFVPSAPDKVVGLEGYPATGPIGFSPTYQYEWPMVYEWSADLSSFGPAPIFVISGQSHHSPGKGGSENDPFPEPPGNGYLTDYGDLPAPYQTLLADGGAGHYVVPNGAFLGALVDPEPDGFAHQEAKGDNNSGADDEDGVAVLGEIMRGRDMVLRLTAGTPGYLSAFVGWNADGTLAPLAIVSASGAAALAPGTLLDRWLTNGVYELTVAVPPNAAETIAARFRFTNNAGEGGATPGSLAISGEVEDYVWSEYIPLSSGIDLHAFQGADGVYAEFVAYDVAQEGTIDLFVLDDADVLIWSGAVAVKPGARRICRFKIPGLVRGKAYNFHVLDEEGNFWSAPGLRVKAFAAQLTRMSRMGLTLAFDSLPEREYEIQWTARLGSAWQTVTNVFTQRERTSVFVMHPDPDSPSGFFRIRLQ